MTGLVLVAVLASADAGFEPVIYSVHHGEVFLDAPDGGARDAPIALGSSTCMDEATTRWIAGHKADSRAQASWWNGQDPWSLPGVRWLLSALGLGLLLGGVGVGLLAWQLLK